MAVLQIPGPHSKEGNKNFQESRPENQPPIPNPSFGACPTQDNTLLDEKSNYNSRMITSNPRFLQHNHGRIPPTMDMIENDVFAEYHKDKGEKPKRTRDAVEGIPGARGNRTVLNFKHATLSVEISFVFCVALEPCVRLLVVE